MFDAQQLEIVAVTRSTLFGSGLHCTDLVSRSRFRRCSAVLQPQLLTMLQPERGSCYIQQADDKPERLKPLILFCKASRP